MIQGSNSDIYDIVISGAGPAGSTCAIVLRNSGLKIALVDRAVFPRDKVCGDAIPGRAVKVLQQLGPEYESSFRNYAPKLLTKSTRLFYNKRELAFDWKGEAYTCARMDFDHFLFEKAAATDIDVFTGEQVTQVSRQDDVFTLKTKTGKIFRSKLLIGADGANGVTARQLAARVTDKTNHVGSVRAYYNNVTALRPDTTEVYFLKNFLPSYMWVFPLPGNRANVGFGMLTAEISRRRLDLKKLFYEFIDQSPQLKARLNGAMQDGPLEGFGLPLGGRKVPISGEGFMLTGDAASIIDPMSGDGIGNAMVSGLLAATQAISCFDCSDLSAGFMQGYDRALDKRLGSELRLHLRSRKLLAAFPGMLDVVFAAGSNATLRSLIQKAL